MTCYYQIQPCVRGHRQRLHAFWKEKRLFQAGGQRLCGQVRMIQKKGWLSQLQLEEIGRHLESGGNNVEAKIEEQNPTATEPIRQVTEEYIAQNEEDEVRDKENPELLINYNNIETIEKKKRT